MAGILKFQRSRKAVQHMALPGEELWEHWIFNSPTERHREKLLTLGELSSLPMETRIALPVRQLISIPLWLQTTDPTLFAEMILVQLEKRALWKTSDLNPPLYYHVVIQDPSRTLLFVMIINPRLTSDYALDLTNDYDFSARCRPLPMDGFTLWREEKRLAIALTCQGQLAYLQSFSSPEITLTVAREILCLQFRLSWEKIIGGDSAAIHLMGVFSASELQAIREVLQVEAQLIQEPVPLWLETPTSLIPPAVTAARNRREKSNRWRQIVTYVAWAYLTVLILLLAQFGWLSYQASSLRKAVDAKAPLVEELEGTSNRWKVLQPAINPSQYPVETLLSCVTKLPVEARLTSFDFGPTPQSARNLILTGESQDAANAFKFLNGLQSEPTLRGWVLTMQQPSLLPNNRATFSITGSDSHETTE